DDGFLRAAGLAVDQNLATGAFRDAQARVRVLVRGTPGLPSVAALYTAEGVRDFFGRKSFGCNTGRKFIYLRHDSTPLILLSSICARPATACASGNRKPRGFAPAGFSVFMCTRRTQQTWFAFRHSSRARRLTCACARDRTARGRAASASS